MSIVLFFFSLLFFDYCLSSSPHIVIIVSCGCNQSTLLLFTLMFFTSAPAGGFQWSLRDSRSPQVSRTLLSILAVLNNAVIWIVSTSPPTSKSSRPFNNPLVIVPITIGTIATFMFNSFFNFLATSRYLSFFSHSFSFILW